ncbi:MAG: YozE family protein [Microcoleus sp.]
MSTRYYFHGDEVESEPGQFYCAYCDSFVDEKHFSEVSHFGTDKERYDRCVKSWEIGQKAQRGLHRPSNASNLFSSLLKPKKPKTSHFYRWLVKQTDRDDPIGDLSKDVKRDRDFPIEIGSLQKIKSHLINQSACNEAIQALEEAHEEFKNNKTVRSGLSLSLRFDVFRRDNYRCQICGATASDGVRLEVDHKDPVVNGGGDEMSNLWTLCFSCNRGKGTKNL